MINKEFGSDFHYFSDAPLLCEFSSFDDEKITLFFSGRVALYNLLNFGIKKYKWNKVGFPSYYCHEVVDFCKNLPIDIIYYNFNPFDEVQNIEWVDDDKNVFVNVDFFGLRKLDTSFLQKSIIIDDLTHNLLSIKESKANYCFGSLRKQLPVAVGGFCYSPNNDKIPDVNTTAFADRVAMQKLSAMFLKSEYLLGNFTEKDIFRNLYIHAENNFEIIQTNSKLPDIIKNQLFKLNEENLIKKTRNNISFAKKNLQLKKCKVHESINQTACGLVLVFEDNNLRDRMKMYLIENKIYPAVLWPSQKTELDIFYEKRILFIHLDFRYSREDVRFIIIKINDFFNYV